MLRYGIRVRYDRSSGILHGDTRIHARVNERLSSFHLDLMLTARRVQVNGHNARFRQPNRHELVVTPVKPLAQGTTITIRVLYHGKPAQVRVPSHLPGEGMVHPWLRSATDTFVNGQPEGAALWFPVNDHPVDKASYDIRARVPRPWQAVSNGHLLDHQRVGRSSVWHWRQPTPVVSYLAFLGLGATTSGRALSPDGPSPTPGRASSATQAAKVRRASATTPERVAWLSRQLGPYPFRHIGGVVPPMNVSTIESQTGPVYNAGALTFSRAQAIDVMVHELAHQWFGDSAVPSPLPGSLAQRGLRGLDDLALRGPARGPLDSTRSWSICTTFIVAAMSSGEAARATRGRQPAPARVCQRRHDRSGPEQRDRCRVVPHSAARLASTPRSRLRHDPAVPRAG